MERLEPVDDEHTLSVGGPGWPLHRPIVPRLKLKWAFGFPMPRWPGRIRRLPRGASVRRQPERHRVRARLRRPDASTGRSARPAVFVRRSPWRPPAARDSSCISATPRPTRTPSMRRPGGDSGCDESTIIRSARITGSPTLFEGRLYVPVASYEEAQGADPQYPCCTFRGSVAALDAESGAVEWKTYMIAESPQRRGTSGSGVPLWGPSGAGIWSAPTVDVTPPRLVCGDRQRLQRAGLARRATPSSHWT